MKRGWCPGVHEPMPSGDGLLIRVKPFGGRLDARKLRVIGDVAAECGNGIVELTSRGNLQLRGLSDENVEFASTALIAAGLADADAARERRRNVIAVPPCDDSLVARIEAVLVEIADLAPKFCVAVGDADADIVVRDGFVLAGDERVACSEHDVPDVVERIARAAGGRRITSKSRSGDIGHQLEFSHDDGVSHRVSALFSSSPCSTRRPPAPPPASRGDRDGRVKPSHDEVKWGNNLLHLPFGQTTAVALRQLAALMGTVETRTTPWRAFHIATAIDAAKLNALGFITDSTDPRRSIAACPGAPACGSATVASRADASFLASLGIENIHVSGCAKGCAHHRAATTLIGSEGRYNLVRYGLAGDMPEVFGLTIAEAAAVLA
jgi:precorrin-3B synthase